MAQPLTPPPNLLGLTFPASTEFIPTTTAASFLSIPAGAVVIFIGVTFLLCYLIPIIISCVCWWKSRHDDRLVEYDTLPVNQTKEAEVLNAVHEEKRKNYKEYVKTFKEKFSKPDTAIDDLVDGEVWVERKDIIGSSDDYDPTAAVKEEDDGGKDRKQPMEMSASNRLTIQPSVFEKLFKKMIFKPTLLEIMKSDERDPSKSLVQNWFEYCQPDFEIPAEIVALSMLNHDSCIDPEVHTWDETAYLVDDQHFIHASVVPMPGEGETGKAIICQAPMDKTFLKKKDTRRHFWKMVFDTKAEFIVMACQNVENKKVKCGRYFPEKSDQGATYDDMSINLTDAREMYQGELMVRCFMITNKDKDETRKVVHYQFLKWKERSIPSGELAMEAFKFVNNQVRRQKKPYICHSSLSTGRACVFVGVEYMCSMICNKRRASTHYYQIDFRTKRMGALQTGEQLYFVQNMAFELLIKEFNFYKFQPEMKIEWERLAHYYEKGEKNRQDLKELEAFEIEKFKEKIPFTSNGKKKPILTVTAPRVVEEKKDATLEELKSRMEAVKKTKSTMKQAASRGTKGTTVTKEGTATKDGTVDKTTGATADNTLSQLPTLPATLPKQDNVENMDLDAEDK
ncbi:unnamed protein product [Caenorhabditis brenneri]